MILRMLNGKIMHVIEWVTKTVNRDGKNLRHLKSQKINLFQSFLYLWSFNLVFMCPTLCKLKTTCLWVMKQKLYAMDAFFIEKLKLSENDPYSSIVCYTWLVLYNAWSCLHFESKHRTCAHSPLERYASDMNFCWVRIIFEI